MGSVARIADKPATAKKVVEKRRYRKVSSSMYADDKFLALSPPKPSGQSLWLYLITGPHTNAVPGLFVAGEAHLAESLNWRLPDFRRCWKEIEDQGMVVTDRTRRLVWLPNAIRHNIPESPNVVTSWKDHLDQLPACPLRDRALWHIYGFLETIGDKGAYAKAFRDVFPVDALKRSDDKREVLPKDFPKALPPPFSEGEGEKRATPSANQEQEQERSPQPPEGLSGQSGPTKPPKPPVPDMPDSLLLDAVLTERAGRFLEGYVDVYAGARSGAWPEIRPGRDWPRAVEAVHRSPDTDRLLLMVDVFLRRKDIGLKNIPGTLGQFLHMAPDCDRLLRENGR